MILDIVYLTLTVKFAQHEFHKCLHYYRKNGLKNVETDYLPFTLFIVFPPKEKHPMKCAFYTFHRMSYNLIIFFPQVNNICLCR